MLKHIVLVAVLAILVISCSEEKQVLDCKRLTDPKRIVADCRGGRLSGEYIGDVKCFPFSESLSIDGVWQVSLERSEFRESGVISGMSSEEIWLEVNSPPAKALASMQGDSPRAYEVSLIGRRSLCPGGFGHFGLSPHQLIVQRFTRIREIAYVDSRAPTIVKGQSTTVSGPQSHF
jgi:hypothetical protein